MKKTLFNEVYDEIHKKWNSNFHFEVMDYPTRVWIQTVCKKLEKRLSKIEKDLDEKTFI